MTEIHRNLQQPGMPFIPFWKKCITAGRAAEGLRADWRMQLKEVQREIGFEYIRFHGLFHDDMMIYREDEAGQPVYNWQYLDNLFDFLKSVGLKPLLELSFMPYALASGEGTVFWWKGNCTPPKDYNRWAELVSNTIRHCINRYGMEEVLKWYFEVWNEPNLYQGFWFADQAEYFKLYETAARAVKVVDPRLRVGGPASSDASAGKAPWVDEFLAFCEARGLPVDFVSTHPYPNQYPLDANGKPMMGYRNPDSTLVDMHKIRLAIEQSAYPNAEIHLTEWNASPSPRDLVHDTAFMASFVVMNNLKCLGLVDSLGFWTFTDVFEENRAGDTLFHGGFGLINGQGLKKASYYGYWFLSKLGGEVIASAEDYFVCRKGDKIQLLMWNYCHYTESFANGDRSKLTELDRYGIFEAKEAMNFQVQVDGLAGNYKVSQFAFDRQHGSAYDAWLALGAPESPTEEELEYLAKQTGPSLKILYLENVQEFRSAFTVQPHGLTLVEIQKIY